MEYQKIKRLSSNAPINHNYIKMGYQKVKRFLGNTQINPANPREENG